jgi:hypothetical protein
MQNQNVFRKTQLLFFTDADGNCQHRLRIISDLKTGPAGSR